MVNKFFGSYLFEFWMIDYTIIYVQYNKHNVTGLQKIVKKVNPVIYLGNF